MNYIIKSLEIRKLLNLIEKDLIDLKPYYQRNDIWSRRDQELLIDSIRKGFPLPSFFIYERKKEVYEMVDGQQRTRTILRFINEQITDSNKKLFNEIDSENFLSYKLCITEIYDVESDKEIEEFYVLVNKRGKHLTTPELHKAEYAGTNFLNTVEELLNYQKLMDLNLFTEASSKRMNDRNFIEELTAYLSYGIQDKKKIIEKIYEQDISEEQKDDIQSTFHSVIDKIHLLNETIVPISKSRYKQRNDFYTLFSFIHQNLDKSINVLKAQYRSLLIVDQYINPSNEDCPPLKEYAINCVSQSNSKKARENRLKFFNSLLLNRESDISKNETIAAIVNFIDDRQLFDVKIKEVEGFYLLSD